MKRALSSPFGEIGLGPISAHLTESLERLKPGKVFLLADRNTAEYCLPKVKEVLHRHIDAVMVIEPGERHKTLESCIAVWSQLVASGADRSSLLINVGGGMICDLGGFAAACYQRGMRFMHIPTTLLAMTDAAIGGKTGIEFQGYKNYLGSFQAPFLVWVDPVFLQTLPGNEIRNGLAEIVKHAIVGSPDLWKILQQLEDSHVPDWYTLLEKSIQVKLNIVTKDPYESGQRKLLNFGHTIGHALESHFLNEGQEIPHGRAVALGMLAESKLALDKKMLAQQDFNSIVEQIIKILNPFGLPLPDVSVLAHWLKGDKKKKDGRTVFSLPEAIGACRWDVDVDDAEIIDAYSWLLAHAGPHSQR